MFLSFRTIAMTMCPRCFSFPIYYYDYVSDVFVFPNRYFVFQNDNYENMFVFTKYYHAWLCVQGVFLSKLLLWHLSKVFVFPNYYFVFQNHHYDNMFVFPNYYYDYVSKV